MQKIYQKTISSPLGFLVLGSSEIELKFVRFSEYVEEISEIIPEILSKTEEQLHEYFEGNRFYFDLKINPEGTEFQKKVWRLVQNVPFGETSTYSEIAQKLGNKNFTRAVGYANSKNQIPIIIPCHRIIGTNKNLIGYAGGLDLKKKLLLHEIQFQKKGILF